jgi:two-component system response regulator PilR (NtrC family)/two-component system response regulator AtoC
MDALSRYLWPGNIRELEHAIERACAVATGAEIEFEDLPDDVRQHADARRPRTQPLRDQELAYIRAVLERHAGDRQQTARELGISLSTLKRRLRLAAVVQRRPRGLDPGQG